MQAIQNIFQSTDEETRRRVIQDLRGRSLQEICSLLFSAMAHGSWDVRIACARTVARLPAFLASQLLALAHGNETNDLVRTRLQSLLKGLS